MLEMTDERRVSQPQERGSLVNRQPCHCNMKHVLCCGTFEHGGNMKEGALSGHRGSKEGFLEEFPSEED